MPLRRYCEDKTGRYQKKIKENKPLKDALPRLIRAGGFGGSPRAMRSALVPVAGEVDTALMIDPATITRSEILKSMAFRYV
jgi:hypothetical protein